MEHSPDLCLVVESPWYQGEPPWLWPVAARTPLTHLPLNGSLSSEDTGLIFGQLVSYNSIPGHNIAELQSGLLDADALILPGGLRIRSGGREIAPACCCGLEEWPEWKKFLQNGVSPWLGHDPSAWAELAGGIVRIWSDGGLQPAPDAFAIEFERSHFETGLRHVENELCAFAERAEHWARDVGFSAPEAVRRKFVQHFLAEDT
jgi:hypothetical protein